MTLTLNLHIRVVKLGAEALDFKREDAGPVLPGFLFALLGRGTPPEPFLLSLPSIHANGSTAPRGPDPILHLSCDQVEQFVPQPLHLAPQFHDVERLVLCAQPLFGRHAELPRIQ